MATPNGQAISDYSGLANYFLKLKIGDLEVPTDSVSSIVIRENIFDQIPRLELMIQDNGSLNEIFPLKDNTIISVEIGKNKDSNHMVADFIVDNFSCDILMGQSSNVFTITAFLNNKNLFFPVKTRAFNNNSLEILKKLASEIGWSAVSKINSSNDKMKFLQINQNNLDFIKHVLERSYIPNDLMFAYAETSNKFTITSLKTAIKSEKFKICRYDLKNAAADSFESKADEQTLWSNGFKHESLMGWLLKTSGYGLAASYYNLKKSVSISSKIDSHDLTEISSQNFNGNMTDSVNFGTLTENMHKNYYLAKIQNRQLLGSQFTNLLTTKINPLGEVSLMDLVNFTMNSINVTQINRIFSGEYLITGICSYASKGAPLQKELLLMRTGTNKSGF
jgi:hypothetical protein